MAAELPKPGVEVMQVFRTVTPTVVTPTLVPSIVGVCKQIVDVLEASATGGQTINGSSLIDLPGFFEATAASGDPPVYTGLDGYTLALSIVSGPAVNIVFVGDSLSPVSVVAQINDQFKLDGVTEALAEVTSDATSFRVRTVGKGEFFTIEVLADTSAVVSAAFGLIEGYVFYGSSLYSQYPETVPLLSFPDPRGNIAELVVEPDTVRVFFGLGSGAGMYEASRVTSHLRKGGSGTAASVTGTVDVSLMTLSTLNTKVLTLALDGGTAQSVTLTTPANHYVLALALNTAFGGIYTEVNNDGFLVVTSKTKGTSSSVKIGGDAATLLGLSTTISYGLAGVSIVDDGNGDAVSPLVQVLGEDFGAVGTAATCTSLVTLAAMCPVTPDSTLTMSVGGKRPQTLVLTGANADTSSHLRATISAFWPDVVATDSGGYLKLTSVAKGEDGMIDIVGGTALSEMGLVPSLTGTVDLGDLLPVYGTLDGKSVKFSDGTNEVQVLFSSVTSSADVVSELNAFTGFSTYFVADLVGDKLRVRLSSSTDAATGISVVPVVAATEAAYLLGMDPTWDAAYFNGFTGSGYPPVSGDLLVVDGNAVGLVTVATPGNVANRVRIDKQLPIQAAYGTHFYMTAGKLVAGKANRPSPDLVVDSNGVPSIKAKIFRDTIGNPVNVVAPVYLAYTALREDVTARAANPALLSYSTTTELEANLAPVNTLNPLALGMYFALLNAPGLSITGLGVDEVTETAPFGTVEAFTRAAEALEQYEVYAIAPLTHDETVAQVFSAHVTSMSLPEAKGERICLFNFTKPSSRLDALVASGLTGNSVGTAGLTFDTGVANLSVLLNAAGINPVGTIPVKSVGTTVKGGLFLSVASTSKRYSISSISGSIVTIRTSFTGDENADSFYSETALNESPMPTQLIDEPFSVKVRGTALVQTNGDPDKNAIAETYQALAQSYMNRRFWSIVPEYCAATLGGMEQVIDGFYLCAGIAGMIGKQPPQQSFTNFPMTGYTRVIGSNDYFTERQLNMIAGGGNYVISREAAGAPLTARMALTTDVTSIETRTDSITKVVDFTAKFMRQGLRTYIGRYNITQGFLDSLGHVVQGLLGFLTDLGVLIGANLNNIVQDENAPDTVLIDVTLDVPYPCNYIRLTLVI